MSIIDIKSLTKKFGDFTAVNNVSLNIDDGEIFGLLGPNGAGKTTIINMLLSLLIPTSGSIKVAGLDNVKNKERIKQMIGLMTQETVVEPDLTGKQNLQLFAQLYHVKESEIDKRVNHALADADLTKFAEQRAGTYSGGMQRRLGLVKAMIQEPRILVLDEPTTGLDVQNRSHMWQRIHELRKRGTTIIMTTQYLEEADELCDRIAVIDHGKIIAMGTPSELKKLVGVEAVLEIVTEPGEIEKIAKILKTKFGLTTTISAQKVDAPLNKKAQETFARITKDFEREGISVLSIGMHQPTLDDVFMKLTGSGMRDTTGEAVSTWTRMRGGAN